MLEKYSPIYEKQAKENQILGGGDKKSEEYKKSVTVNLPQPIRNPTTDKKLSEVAGVSEKTYRMGTKVLNSDNEDIKQRVLSGETSISAGYDKNYGYQLLLNKKFYKQDLHNKIFFLEAKISR